MLYVVTEAIPNIKSEVKVWMSNYTLLFYEDVNIYTSHHILLGDYVYNISIYVCVCFVNSH